MAASEEKENIMEKKFYDSPSRDFMETPITRALRNSKNNLGVFLENLEALNKFKNGMKKINIKDHLKEHKTEGLENENPFI